MQLKARSGCKTLGRVLLFIRRTAPTARPQTEGLAFSFFFDKMKNERGKKFVKIYRMHNDRNGKVTENFKVREYACKDGSDLVLVDEELAKLLQEIRNRLGPVHINSGFRTASWNDKVGGKPYSYHLAGMAADIWVKDVSPKKVAQTASAILDTHGGVILYTNFVHVDVRKDYYRKGV